MTDSAFLTKRKVCGRGPHKGDPSNQEVGKEKRHKRMNTEYRGTWEKKKKPGYERSSV